MKKTKKIKRKKKTKSKSIYRLLLRQKRIITVVALLAVVVAALVLTRRGGYMTGASRYSGGVNSGMTLINTTSNAVWNGSDPSLKHDIGSKGIGNSWNSAGEGPGYLALGPHVNLGPDSYLISLQLKVDGTLNDSMRLGKIEITKDNGDVVLFRKQLYGRDFGESGKYEEFPTQLVSSKIMEDVEFKVYSLASRVNMSIGRINLYPAPTAWLGNDPSLSHDIGVGEAGGLWASGTKDAGYMVSGGPNINLAPGQYAISYTFMIESGRYNDSENIATMEVSGSRGAMGLWNGGKLTGFDYNSGRSSDVSIIRSFGNIINVNEPINNVTFMLYRPNSTINIKLTLITLYSR
jgi:hypothetical protein